MLKSTMPPIRGIEYLSLCLYGIRVGGFHVRTTSESESWSGPVRLQLGPQQGDEIIMVLSDLHGVSRPNIFILQDSRQQAVSGLGCGDI